MGIIENQEHSPKDSLHRFILNSNTVIIKQVTLGERLRGAYLGPEGTFSEEVAYQMNNRQADLLHVASNTAVVEAVDRGEFDLGFVAFENSTEGTVIQTLKAIIHSDLNILGEKTIPIKQNLFGTPEAKLKGIVNSHPQAFAQSAKWLGENIPGYLTQQVNSTAEGVRLAKEKDEMGIGTMRAGEIYNIPLLQEGIEDNKLNFTRFWLIGKGETRPTGNDRTWIALTLKNEAGALKRVIDPFAERKISINKIDTPPLTMDHYYFFIAIDGHQNDFHVAKSIEEARKACWELKPIGSFEKSILPTVQYEPLAYEKGWIPNGE
ncbi:MAG TPA: prephenate dehydratase domain-containing protein [Candidatus Levybacteria bacterium]|nr:prephenate dehydratase domain-containing protein [Candidatus Levybacteria bacterium]